MPSKNPFQLSFEYPTGVARDLWVARSDSWVAVAVGFQRDHRQAAAKQPVGVPAKFLDSTGVYILRGWDKSTNSTLIYVGQGDEVKVRLDEHRRNQDWWSEAVAIVSKSNDWDSSQVRFIEAQLFRYATEAKRCVLMNGNTPQGDRKLKGAKEAVAKELLEGIEQRLPALGYPEFPYPESSKSRVKQVAATPPEEDEAKAYPQASPATPQPQVGAAAKSSGQAPAWEGPSEAEFRFSGKDYHAYGRRRPSGKFEVLPGSRASLTVSEKCPESARRERDRHMQSGALEQRDDHLFFREAAEFGSASAAAQAVAGFSINGKIAWRARDRKPLGDL